MKENTRGLADTQKTVTLKKTSSPTPSGASKPAVTAETMKEKVAVKAYELYEKRGRAHGHDLRDWFEAEQLILSRPRPAAK